MERIIASLLLAGLVFAAGCKKDNPTDKSGDSKSGTTSAPLTIPKSGIAHSPAQCRKLCLAVGKCSLEDGKCVATSTAACKTAYGCRTAGLCVAKDGLCVAASNADCEASDLCKSEGRCIAVNGRCENKAVDPSNSGAPAGSGSPAASSAPAGSATPAASHK